MGCCEACQGDYGEGKKIKIIIKNHHLYIAIDLTLPDAVEWVRRLKYALTCYAPTSYAAWEIEKAVDGYERENYGSSQ